MSSEPIEDKYFTIEPVITITFFLAINFLLLNLIIGCTPTITSIFTKICICALLSLNTLILIILFGIYWLMLGGKNYYGVIYHIIIITLIPTIATVFILMSAPTEAIGLFENTIGYFYCINRYKTQINEIFDVNNGISEDCKNMFEEDKTVLLSLFNFEDVFDGSVKTIDTNIYNFNIKKDGVEINQLKELQNIVSVKNTIGIFSWFFIVSLCSSIISLKILAQY